MTITTQIKVSGVAYEDFKSVKVHDSIGQNNTSSNFRLVLDNPFGRHDDDFTIGDTILIQANSEKRFIGPSNEFIGSFTSPAQSPRGLTHSGLDLISADLSTDHIYHHSGISNILIGSIAAPGSNLAYVAYDAGSNHLLSHDGPGIFGTGFVYIHNGISTTLLGSFDIGTQKQGLYYDGRDLWTATSGTTQNFVRQHSGLSNVILGSFLTPGFRTKGITIDDFGRNGSNLVLTDTFGADTIYFHSGLSSELLGSFIPAPGGVGIEGVEYVGSNIIASSQIKNHIYIINNLDLSTRLLNGFLEKVNFIGKGTKQRVNLVGKDFTIRLLDATVEPVVFNNSEVSTIVTNIINTNVSDITTNNVQVTEITVPRITFNHQSVFNALQELSLLAKFIFFVDKDGDLHFEPKEDTRARTSFDNTNITKTKFDSTREGMANKIWVYGDRYLTGKREGFDATAGSVYTLQQKPHNTEVESSAFAGSILKGGIFEFGTLFNSGADYLVNFDDKQIIFVSGTDIGYDTIPDVGGSIIVNYDRDTPIVKFGQLNTSIRAFGPKVKIIQDTSIKDPRLAVDILKREIENADPTKRIRLDVKGWFTNNDFKVGNITNVTLDDFGLAETESLILDKRYNINGTTRESENVISVSLNKKVTDITDSLTEIERRLLALESTQTQAGDFLTRLEFGIGSMLVLGSRFEVGERWNGSGFILGGSGVARSSGLTTGPFLGRLGSFPPGSASHLGFAGRTDLEVQTSGGFLY